MKLAPEFQFSQGVLQDFVDCRRRFRLRYLEQLAWPAIVADPVLSRERRLRLGVQFHRLVQQHQLGLPQAQLSALAFDEDLQRWWQNYLAHGPVDLPAQRHPETALSATLGGVRLLAKYDLLAVHPGRRLVIVDWKTNQHRPQRAWLAKRLQTRVYRYVLARCGQHLNAGAPLDPAQLEMRYWFAEFPQQPECFAYDQAQFEEDEAYLSGLIETIQRLQVTDFSLTEEQRHCRYCAYRSLCERGVAAHVAQDDQVPDPQDTIELGLDLEQIDEIEF